MAATAKRATTATGCDRVARPDLASPSYASRGAGVGLRAHHWPPWCWLRQHDCGQAGRIAEGLPTVYLGYADGMGRRVESGFPDRGVAAIN